MKISTLFVLLATLFFSEFCIAQPEVTLTDKGNEVVLANQYVQVTVNKQKALISSLVYKGQELVATPAHTNWNIVGYDDDDSFVRRVPDNPVYRVLINPQKNGGERAEVSFLYTYNGASTTAPLDLDLRVALGKHDQGVYLSALFRHKANYPAFSIGQGRMIITLNPGVFDFYTVDEKRRRQMATAYDVAHGIRKNVKEASLLVTGIHKGEVEHKYDYAAMLAQTPTWGWTSTQAHVGIWMINPSAEYINGGPTQIGITGHVATQLLNHWMDGHYGGQALNLAKGEEWTKFIGPFLLYCNSGINHDSMWFDALNQAKKQQALWPFDWVKDSAYPGAEKRGTVDGRIEVKDAAFRNLWVGLADASPHLNWQYEGKKYQFWTKADDNGNFCIKSVRAGNYTLYAFADGIPGEFSQSGFHIGEGSTLHSGTLVWTPLKYGKTLWEIGIPDRSAAEFRHGNDYWHWGLYMLYPKEFPEDVNYYIGKSDWSKDWNYCQPTVIGDDYKVLRGTNWRIFFDTAQPLQGKATLRIGICGSRGGEQVKVYLNDNPIGTTGPLPHMGVMHRDGIRGKQVEIAIPFDAALLKQGTNCIRLGLNARNWTFGVLYDYLRLELNQQPTAH